MNEEKENTAMYGKMKIVAEKALERYPLNISEISFLCVETNVFFKAVTREGKKYALKIFQEESGSIRDNEAEEFFLKSLNGIETPSIIENDEGKGITLVNSRFFPEPKRVAVYTWIEGEDLDGNETPELFYKVGKIMAKLHLQTERIEIPDFITPKRRDKVFYYEGEKAVTFF